MPKILTKDIAEQFILSPETIDLSDFETMGDDGAAKIFGDFEGPLDLSGLTGQLLYRFRDYGRLLCRNQGNQKALVKYRVWTGDAEIEGMFISNLSEYLNFVEHGDTVYLNLIDHSGLDIEISEKSFHILTIDQELIRKLELLSGKNVCGENIFELAIKSLFEGIDDDLPPVNASNLNHVINKKVLTNSIGMQLIQIPNGIFLMGEIGNEHQVEISKSFYLGMTQVTQSQFEQVMHRNPSVFKLSEVDTSDLPVESVSWEDAVRFCKMLSELPSEKKEGRTYRLPTDAEWEYACRAGKNGDDPFFDANEMNDYIWNDSNSGSITHRVAMLRPNEWGLYDMRGNVDEWCNDWFADYPKCAVIDPMGPDDGSERIVRGGNYSDIDGFYWNDRSSRDPLTRERYIGFRVVMTTSEVP